MTNRFGLEQFIFALATGRGDLTAAVEVARQHRMPEHVLNVLRDAVSSGTTLDENSEALVDRRTMAAGFVDELRSASFTAAIYNDTVRPGFHTALAIATAGFEGGPVNDGAIKLLSKMSVGDAGGKLTPQQLVSFAFMTQELLRVISPGTLAAVRAALLRAVAAALDAYGIGRLLDGATVLPSVGDPSRDALDLLAIVNTHGAGRLYWAVTPNVANQLTVYRGVTGQPAFPTMTPNGGTWYGRPVIVTDQLPVETAGQVDILLCDASGVAAEIELAPRVATAQAAALDVQDDADGSASEVVSLWQTNSVAVRAEQLAAVTRMRATAVAAIADASYMETLP